MLVQSFPLTAKDVVADNPTPLALPIYGRAAKQAEQEWCNHKGMDRGDDYQSRPHLEIVQPEDFASRETQHPYTNKFCQCDTTKCGGSDVN